ILDAVCQGCGKPIRWLSGTPLLCADCAQKKASQAFFAAILVALLVSLIVSACGPIKSGARPIASPTNGTLEQPMLVRFRPYTVVQGCLDITGSYPYADFKKAEGKIADSIEEQFVRPNTGGLLVFGNVVTANS